MVLAGSMPRRDSPAPCRARCPRSRRCLPGCGGQHVQVGDDEEALVLVLQAHAVAQAAHVVAQVQPAGGPVAGQDAFSGRSSFFSEIGGRKQGNKQIRLMAHSLVSLFPVPSFLVLFPCLLIYLSTNQKRPIPSILPGTRRQTSRYHPA